jgi:hypothetical protein
VVVYAISCAAGLAVLITGAVKFAMTSGDGGAITMVIAGGLLVILPLILERVERISLAGAGVELWLVTEVTSKGAPEAAKILRRTDLASIAGSYALAHAELTGPDFRDARKCLQDLLVRRAAAIASREKFSASEVRMLFVTGSPVVRVLALGLMQGDISLADITTLIAAISDSRSGNEQYQGLQLALHCSQRLTPSDWQQLRDAISQARFETGSDRHQLAQQLLGTPAD